MASRKQTTVLDRGRSGNYLARMSSAVYDTQQEMPGLTASLRFNKLKEQMEKRVAEAYKGQNAYDPAEPELRPFSIASLSTRDKEIQKLIQLQGEKDQVTKLSVQVPLLKIQLENNKQEWTAG